MTEHPETYDAVPYPGAPYWFSHPANLAVLARLFGLSAPPVANARVLELGCAGGRNLLPMAASLPAARVVGLESSPRQVRAAGALAATAGLENVALLEQGFETLGEEHGLFDYIVAHGVYSWVSPTMRRELLRVCRERLAPGGLVYVSYNTMPGWALAGVARRLLLSQLGDEPPTAAREAAALELLETVAAASAGGPGPLPDFYRAEVERLRAQRPGYLTHEHLEPDNHPVYVETFLAEARVHNLAFVSSALRERMDPAVWPEPLVELLAAEHDLGRQQQTIDFVANTRFRADVLAAKEATAIRRPEPDAGALDGLYAHCDLPRDALAVLDPGNPDPVVLTTPSGREERIASAALEAALVTLVEAAPRALPVAELVAAGGPALLPELTRLYLAELIELSAAAPPVASEVGERPRVTPLARAEATMGDWVTNQWHRPVVLDAAERALVAQLDGRLTRAELGEARAAQLERLARHALLVGA